MCCVRWVAICALLFSLTCSLQTAAQEIDVRAEVDRTVEPYLEQGSFVGLVVGVVKDGERHVFAYGETEKGSGKQPTGETLYEIGSITKVFTGILLADAVERELVALDDLVGQHLPQSVTMPIAGDQPIRLVHLATHTSGLPRLPHNMPVADRANPYADYSQELLFEFLNTHTLRRPPGKKEYSNLAMGLLGQVLALKSECSYEDLLLERICQPLQMDDTRITLNDQQRTRLALPYNTWFFRVKNWDLAALAGAGAIRSTCDDLLKFIEAHFVEDDQTITQALRSAQTVHHSLEGGQDIGLAWHRTKDKITWWHNGQTGGYSAYLAIMPSHNLGVVVLTNRSTSSTTEIGEKLTQAVFRLGD